MRVRQCFLSLLLVSILVIVAGCSSSPLGPQGSGNDDWSDWPSDFESLLSVVRDADGNNGPDPIPHPDPIPLRSFNLIAWTRIIPPNSESPSYMPNPEIGIMTNNGMHKWRFTYWWGVDDHPSWGKYPALTWQSNRGPHASSIGPTLDIFKRALNSPSTDRLTIWRDNFHPDWDKGRIAWVKDMPDPSTTIEHNSIFTMKADGSDWQGPFGTWTRHTDPMWSPDGKKIAFSAFMLPICPGAPERWDLFIMDADGSNMHNLTQHLGNPSGANIPVIFTEPAFSRDGKKLAFASNYQCNWDIYYWNMLANTAQPFKITHSWACDRHPSWSPNGKWIAFSSNRYCNNFEIYKMKVPSPNDPVVCSPKRLTWSPYPDIHPDWSPKLYQMYPVPGPDPEPIPEP